jgi:hypothetical protein
MESSWKSSLPYKTDLRCFVHFSLDKQRRRFSCLMPAKTRSEIDFFGSGSSEFSLFASLNLFPLLNTMKNCLGIFSFVPFQSRLKQIVEYDLMESLKESRGLVMTFAKRLFQSAVPVSMTLIYNSRKNEEQLLIADSNMKFKIFDKNTFEILATFAGPIYDSYVKQFVSIYGTNKQATAIIIHFDWVKSSIKLYPLIHFSFFLPTTFFSFIQGCKHIAARSNDLFEVLRLRHQQQHLSLRNTNRWKSIQKFGNYGSLWRHKRHEK